jgi:hypothetical protein
MRLSSAAVALLGRARRLSADSITGAPGSAERAWLELDWLATTTAVGSIAVSSVPLFEGHT